MKLPSPWLIFCWVLCSSFGTDNENKSHFGIRDDDGGSGDGRSGGHILRRFLDDWPTSLQKSDIAESSVSSSINSVTCLSMSMPENTSSDVSLKLFTGYGENLGSRNGDVERERQHINWAGRWSSADQVASMGGPLAEALRSSASTSSLMNVLRQLPCISASQNGFIGTLD